MKKINNEFEELYKKINSDFYEEIIRSANPLRRWFHTNRYYVINTLVKSKYRKGMKILDLGCGSCNWNADRLEVFGVDFNEGLLRLAKDNNRLYEYKVADVNDAKLDHEAFDIVIASDLLEHIEDYDSLIEEIMRILKCGGCVIVSVPYDTYLSLWKYLFFLQVILHGHLLRNQYYRKRCGHINAFSPDKLKASFLKHGFDIEEVFAMRRFNLFLVARKKGLPKESLSSEDLTIILPTLNEEANIKDLLGYLTSYYKNASIIVTDDGSIDKTKEIVMSFKKQKVSFLDRKDEKEHGLCISILEAIGLVKTKYFIVMDADGQHPPEKIEEILNSLRLGNRFVLASRVKIEGRWSLQRKIISYLATLLGKLSLLIRNKYMNYDILTGFFGSETTFWNLIAFDKDNILRFRSKGYKLVFDFLKILSKRVKIGEVYYKFNSRRGGASKINFKIYIEYLKSIFE